MNAVLLLTTTAISCLGINLDILDKYVCTLTNPFEERAVPSEHIFGTWVSENANSNGEALRVELLSGPDSLILIELSILSEDGHAFRVMSGYATLHPMSMGLIVLVKQSKSVEQLELSDDLSIFPYFLLRMKLEEDSPRLVFSVPDASHLDSVPPSRLIEVAGKYILTGDKQELRNVIDKLVFSEVQYRFRLER